MGHVGADLGFALGWELHGFRHSRTYHIYTYFLSCWPLLFSSSRIMGVGLGGYANLHMLLWSVCGMSWGLRKNVPIWVMALAVEADRRRRGDTDWRWNIRSLGTRDLAVNLSSSSEQRSLGLLMYKMGVILCPGNHRKFKRCYAQKACSMYDHQKKQEGWIFRHHGGEGSLCCGNCSGPVLGTYRSWMYNCGVLSHPTGS